MEGEGREPLVCDIVCVCVCVCVLLIVSTYFVPREHVLSVVHVTQLYPHTRMLRCLLTLLVRCVLCDGRTTS
jgi:hypothetical protein